MKKIFLVIGLVGIALMQFQNARAQYVTIPDSNFVAWLQDNYPNCMNGNQMDTTCSQIVSTTSANCSFSNISDLNGIQFFDNIETLNCEGNILTNFIIPSTLTVLNCNECGLLSIPALPSSLQILSCGMNGLSSLPSLPNTLIGLECPVNLFQILPSLPPNLTSLYCWNNYITSLPTLPETLTALNCSGNYLSELPALPDTMYMLKINYNSDIQCLPPIQAYIGPSYYFDISNTSIICLPNVIQHDGYIAAIDTMPICGPDSCTLANTCFVNTNCWSSSIGVQSATINWNSNFATVKYRVQVKNMSTGIVNLYFVNAPDTTKSLLNLTANTTYQVKVRSQCSASGSVLSPWSNTITFTTSGATNCIYPTNLTANPTSNSSATISWTPISGAAGYQLRYKPSNQSFWNPIVIIPNGSTSSYNLTTLSPNTTYKYQVRTKCSINPLTWSTFSPIQQFTTPLRLGEEEITSQIQLYPNPSNGTVTFTSNDLVGTLYVYDIVGKEILHQVVSENEITLNDLPNGLLTYKFVSENGLVATDKFVVIR